MSFNIDSIFEDGKEAQVTALLAPEKKTRAKAKVKEEVPVVPKPVYKNYEDYEYDDLMLYAGIDCVVTSGVLAKIFPQVAEEPTFYLIGENGEKITAKAPSILKGFSEIEMLAHDYILDLEINGMMYDQAKNAEINKRMNLEVAELQETVFSVTGEFNWKSGVEMQNLLYGKMGFEPPSTTKSGDPSTDGDALLMLAGIDPMSFKYQASDPALQWLANMAKMKDIDSVNNTFIRNYIKDFVKRDGRIHPSYNLHGTSSHRITGSDPNLTQLPRAKHGYNVRECYVVPPGYVFICCDWSSAEVKILGALSRDPALLRAIALGYDFHSFSASQMIGVPYEDFMGILAEKGNPKQKEYKNTRQSAKALTFGIDIGTYI